ncbi:MAG: hypothetical protein JKY19_13610 [Alcanivoracaceae bacterium]|nr:hypothetical protein [Alcanivoracaceae bacterium]
MNNNDVKDKKQQLRKDPPKPGQIRLSILIENNGFVKFGDFETKDFQFEGDFPKSRPIQLIATPTKNIEFLSWSLKTGIKEQFVFVSDQTSVTIKNPIKNMTINASFTAEIN